MRGGKISFSEREGINIVLRPKHRPQGKGHQPSQAFRGEKG
jgi:hypothetical protein